MLHTFLISLAVLALLSIIFEEITHLNKAKTTLFFGCIAWATLFITAQDLAAQEVIAHKFNENLLEIATLWLFLMSTMTFVAYLNAKGMIQVMVQKIFPHTISVRLLMIQVGLFSLLLSAFCDNVTATLVSVGLLYTFKLESHIRLRMAILIIFAVNSGGVALITGDVTTLMIFLSGHVKMSELIILFLPASISVILLAMMFSHKVQGIVTLPAQKHHYEKVDLLIAVIFVCTIIMTMLCNVFFDIPPVLTFLTGLSIMFLVGHIFRSDKEEIKILEYIRQV
ncbi:MAG: sodium:proton antiporter NhaD, partial [Shewanella sp.]